MDGKKIYDKVLNLLRVRPPIGGLEISDSTLRFAIWDGSAWTTKALRLPPNLVQGGKIMNYPQFVQLLRDFHADIAGGKNKLVNVVVSLSSVNVYSQVFSLPVIEGENLEKAIQLNIQMVSPAQSSETYSGWQLVGEDQQAVRLEILSSFINRVVVDEILKALREAKFVVHSVESRALSLTRLIRQLAAGFDKSKSYFALSLDSSGLEFVVIRRSQLYFHYFNSWRDLYGSEKQISKAAFEAAVIRNLHQVLNFYNSHWSEPLEGIFISSTALHDDLVRILRDNFQMNILELQLSLNPPINPDWYVCLGSGLRPTTPQKEDQEISLLGISAQEEFLRSQSLLFLNFWSIMFPIAMSLMFLVLAGANWFLANTEARLKSEVSFGTPEQVAEIQHLQDRVTEFNRVVQMIQDSSVKSSRIKLVSRLQEMAAKHNVALLRVNYQAPGFSVTLSGKAPSEGELGAFVEELKGWNELSNVDLQLNQVKEELDGFTFSVPFVWTPSSAS
jgi:hypothetical protein